MTVIYVRYQFCETQRKSFRVDVFAHWGVTIARGTFVRDLPVVLTMHVRLTEPPTVRDMGRGEMVTWGGTACACERRGRGKNMCKGRGS